MAWLHPHPPAPESASCAGIQEKQETAGRRKPDTPWEHGFVRASVCLGPIFCARPVGGRAVQFSPLYGGRPECERAHCRGESEVKIEGKTQ